MNVVLRVEPARVEELRAFLHRGGFALESRPHALLFAQRPGVSLTAYASGKLLLTGEQAEEYAGVLAGQALASREEDPRPTLSGFAPHAGADESGKGDYFGPLCVAAVFVPDAATAAALVAKGVRDSKLVPDAEAALLASLVRARCPHAIETLPPPAYNEVYARYGNLNTLLAAMHAAALEQLLSQVGEADVLVDQFAHPGVLERQLRERGRAARVRQAVRAEADVAVAAASLVARAEFLAGLARLEVEHGVKLAKGAGPPVIRAARTIAARGGRPALAQVAKMHFATTRSALP
ncbi:MAG: ribonuclease [Thermoplasmata archaeon]|nr:ribonuclease [Thermoplasmata archaeon]